MKKSSKINPIIGVKSSCTSGNVSIPPFVDRLLLERKELFVKYTKLDSFLSSPSKYSEVPDLQLKLMREQRKYMYQYLKCISTRLSVFFEENNLIEAKVK